MKDYIELTDKENKKRNVEIVTIFQLDGYNYNYIIYRELDNSHTYIAKYKGDNIVNLNTDFNEEELKLANMVFRGVKQ